jgi:hypothetical protein
MKTVILKDKSQKELWQAFWWAEEKFGPIPLLDPNRHWVWMLGPRPDKKRASWLRKTPEKFWFRNAADALQFKLVWG